MPTVTDSRAALRAPDSLNPAIVAMASSRVDLPSPFSPTMIVIAFSKVRSNAPIATFGRSSTASDGNQTRFRNGGGSGRGAGPPGRRPT